MTTSSLSLGQQPVQPWDDIAPIPGTTAGLSLGQHRVHPMDNNRFIPVTTAGLSLGHHQTIDDNGAYPWEGGGSVSGTSRLSLGQHWDIGSFLGTTLGLPLGHQVRSWDNTGFIPGTLGRSLGQRRVYPWDTVGPVPETL
ncbi:unnamed protein product [Ixodes pacificus]